MAWELHIVKSISIVDDHPKIRRGLTMLLAQDADFTVVGEAENGLEAISKAQVLKPSVVLLDISMPVMNGLDAARELKRILPKTGILMLTSHAFDGLKEAALAAGVDAIQPKDFLHEVVKSIRELVDAPLSKPLLA
jgi:two-component system, NarL family, nitrate/nitrite response regulator NarL